MQYYVTSVFVFVVLLLNGCATSRTIVGQDGKPLHKISCDGAAQSIDACYEKAGELCASAGYDILSQDGSAQQHLFVGSGSFYAVPMVSRTVLVRCRAERGITGR